MTLEELKKVGSVGGPVCDPCQSLIKRKPTIVPGRPLLEVGNHAVIVVDEQGMAWYMKRHPDGHLGAIED